jgi:phage anti-repressor protein
MFVETEGISEGKLVRKAGQLFKGAALEWYLSSKHRFERWRHIVRGLREAFLPENNDYYVLQQCERRPAEK